MSVSDEKKFSEISLQFFLFLPPKLIVAISSGNDKFQSGIKRGKGKSWTTSSDLDSAADWLWKKVTSKKNRRRTYSSFLPSQLITEQRASSITGAIITCSIRTRNLEMSLCVYHHYWYSSTRQGHSSIGTHRTASCAKDYWRKLKKGNRTLALNKTKHTHPRYETNVPRFSMLTGGISLFCKRRRMRKGVHQTTLYTGCYCFRCRYTKDAGKSVIALHHHHQRNRFATALGRLWHSIRLTVLLLLRARCAAVSVSGIDFWFFVEGFGWLVQRNTTDRSCKRITRFAWSAFSIKGLCNSLRTTSYFPN